MKESDKRVPLSNSPNSTPSRSATASLHTDATEAVVAKPADEQIRIRAYEIYRERGGRVGDDMSDWLRAEREYLEHLVGCQSTAGDADHRAGDSLGKPARR